MGAVVGFVRAIASAMFLVLPGLVVAQDASDTGQLRMLGRCNSCEFKELDLSGSNMMGVDLSESTLRDVDFTGADLGIAIFDNAVLENVSFEDADLSGASFAGSTLIDVSFDRSDMTAAVFEGAILEQTDLKSGVLCNTQMPNDLMDNSDCD
jgi:uncharacterized protein YjbI with pentapeptide repeats